MARIQSIRSYCLVHLCWTSTATRTECPLHLPFPDTAQLSTRTANQSLTPCPTLTTWCTRQHRLPVTWRCLLYQEEHLWTFSSLAPWISQTISSRGYTCCTPTRLLLACRQNRIPLFPHWKAPKCHPTGILERNIRGREFIQWRLTLLLLQPLGQAHLCR